MDADSRTRAPIEERPASWRFFISYRHDDADWAAGRLSDRLVGHFGERAVFIDVGSIHPGRDFSAAIDTALRSCSVMIAMIGTRWVGAADDGGHRRLDDPADYVALEIRSALGRGIPVIPLLVDGAKPPRAHELPQDLGPLVLAQAVRLDHHSFESDFAALATTLEQLLVGVLAADADEVVAEWYKHFQESDPVAWAVLTAIADIRRLGCAEPVTFDALSRAIPGYLKPTQRGHLGSTADVIRDAIKKAAQPVAGVTPLTHPRENPSIGEPDCFELDSSLARRVDELRRRSPVPQTTWDAAVALAGSVADCQQLELRSHNQALEPVSQILRKRLETSQAEPLRPAWQSRKVQLWQMEGRGPAAGDAAIMMQDAWHELWSGRPRFWYSELGWEKLVRREIRARDAVRSDDIAWLRSVAGSSDESRKVRRAAGVRLAQELARSGDHEAVAELRDLAANAPWVVRGPALIELTDLLVREDDVTAVADLRHLVEPGSGFRVTGPSVALTRYVNDHVTDFLARRADADALRRLRHTEGAGRRYAHQRLAQLLFERALERHLTAPPLLNELAELGDEFARQRLTDLLFHRASAGDPAAVRELRIGAESEVGYMRQRFLDHQLALAEQGDEPAISRLRDLADDGDVYAADLLARALGSMPDPAKTIDLLQAEVFAANSRHAADALLQVLSREFHDATITGLTATAELAVRR